MNNTDRADIGGAPLRDKNRQMHRRILSLVHTLQVRADDALDYEQDLHATLAETGELP